MNRNYQKELDALIEKNQHSGITPKLMLHACCACCLSYVLEYLSEYFHIYILYSNPNITEEDEYNYRFDEVKRLVSLMKVKNKAQIVECEYTPKKYLEAVAGLENEPERGARCSICFNLRLEETARMAEKYECDYFATTLTISPLKNASIINSIGERIADDIGVAYLFSDFKKKERYKRSIELSKEYNLYRQTYCGCVFSKQK